ncbi:MAG: hypothetical protein HUJ69_05980 [Lachnospiraceae bacterium]|nr:hypothetical protein [Lachnospiraceae bacterium]
MFNFKEELSKYRKSLEISDLSEGVSGDEIRDIFDIARELVNARDVFAPEPIRPKAPGATKGEQESAPEGGETDENPVPGADSVDAGEPEGPEAEEQ